MSIRQLNRLDLPYFKAIRLEALQDPQKSFSVSYNEECAQADTYFIDKLEQGLIMAAFDDQEIVSIAGMYQLQKSSKNHIGRIWTVYTKPAYRRQGVSVEVMEALLEKGKEFYKIAQSSIWSGNEAALKLYEKIGFEQYGYEKQGRKLEHGYEDEIHMMKFL